MPCHFLRAVRVRPARVSPTNDSFTAQLLKIFRFAGFSFVLPFPLLSVRKDKQTSLSGTRPVRSRRRLCGNRAAMHDSTTQSPRTIALTVDSQGEAASAVRWLPRRARLAQILSLDRRLRTTRDGCAPHYRLTPLHPNAVDMGTREIAGVADPR